MIQDLRFALRMLLKKPGFSAVVVFTLALGIGANVALFTVVNGVLLKPLPFPDSEQLVTLHQSKPNFEAGAIPYPNFLDLQAQNQTFSAIAISRPAGFSLIGAGEPERVDARLISSEFFNVLGVTPQPGRSFTREDDREGASPVVLISARLWERKFSSAPDVTSRTVTLDDKTYAVVGVVPSSFTIFRSADIYVPIGAWGNPLLKNRGAALGLHGVGRLKPGITVAQGQADLERIMANLAVAYPDTNKGHGSKVVALRERVLGDIQPTLLMLFGAVGFVLLIACVNVSNLMLARSTARAREFAIRTALGANRFRLLRQSLIESTVLSVLGGGLGLVVAAWSTKLAVQALPTALPRADEIGLDLRVLFFTVAISLLTGILAGLTPALKASQWRVNETMKEGGRGAGTGRVRVHGVFVAAEMAMALVLLIGAGLMIRSLTALWRVDPGFNANNVVTFFLNLSPSMRSSEPAVIRNSIRDLNNKLAHAPGVTAVSFMTGASPMQSEDDLNFWIEGQPKPNGPSEMPMSLFYVVEPDYIKAMSIPLKQGRFFTDQDDDRSPAVAVIDEVFAKKHFANQNPLGKRLFLGSDEYSSEIVGVVGHVKQWGLDSDDNESLRSQVYIPFRSFSDNAMTQVARGFSVALRTESSSDDKSAVFNSIRQVVREHNGQNVVSQLRTMNHVIEGTLGTQRFSMFLLGTFAVVALVLASIGIYGVISYVVGQRTHELGIRIALGASRRDIFRLVLGHGMKMAIAGVAIGLVAAFGLTRLMTKMLFGVSATDPLTFAAISLLLALVALLACYLPARRATKVDPLVALRSE